jgi:putative hydrolase of the HAD superfamily
VLVEDTLVHQKAARAVGMGTVWVQRYARGGDSRIPQGTSSRSHTPMRPTYVDRVVHQLRTLVHAQGLSRRH